MRLRFSLSGNFSRTGGFIDRLYRRWDGAMDGLNLPAPFGYSRDNSALGMICAARIRRCNGKICVARVRSTRHGPADMCVNCSLAAVLNLLRLLSTVGHSYEELEGGDGC